MARGNNEIELRDLVRLCHKAINGRYPFVRSATEDVRLDDFADLFGPGRKIDEFFRAKLESQVDTATNPWTYKPAPGAVANQGSAALQQFQRAKVIREVFFRSGASPAMRLEFKPVEMDAAITNFTLDIDGDVVRYSHGPQVVKSVQWPGPSGRQQVRIEISPTPLSGQGALLFQGPWALFRMVERAQLQSIGPEKFLISFVIDGRKAQFEVATSSVRNPFTLPEFAQFQCPGV